MTATDTSIVSDDAARTVAGLRATFESGRTRPLAWREAQLDRLQELLVREEAALLDALHADLGKPAIEGWAADIALTRTEARLLRKNLGKWTAPGKARLGVTGLPGTGRIVREPLGTALIIGPWNYPMQLVLVPLAGALAAGCTAAIKPSELAPASSAALARLVPQYLDTDAVAVVEGGVAETTALLDQRWDTIFYTGNGTVGRVVARAAAEHLTPVTLELGGKSPAIVDRDANLAVAAKRIAWGKLLNAGQTCVAPDHVLVHEAVHDELVSRIGAAVRSMYGDDPARSSDYARIVNERHFDRVVRIIDEAGPSGRVPTIAVGGERVRDNLYIAPTVLTDVADDAPAMGEEIFGPVLPILPVRDVDDAIARVNAGDKPLALYAFSENADTLDHVVASTSSGGVALNHTVLHLASPSLPFGGVGESGHGAYHGRANIDAFSHRRSVLSKPTRFDPPLVYPPFTKLKQAVLRRALTWF
jgi:aldehyde dehydrogenase (NAD+)